MRADWYFSVCKGSLFLKNSVQNVNEFLEMFDLKFSTDYFINCVKNSKFSIRTAEWNLFITLKLLMALNKESQSSGSLIIYFISFIIKAS